MSRESCNIVLTGMMGSGKTTVGNALAKQLGRTFIDTDAEIEKDTGMTISQIFQTRGEPYFRKLESEKIASLPSGGLVISLGGGAFENPETREILLTNSTVIYLKASPETLAQRLNNSTDRPLADKLPELLQHREPNYAKARITIDTTDKSPDNIVKEITCKLMLK
ncbi:MAG: shikimate kinase [Heliobacteriaceae bacterium]|nr:shikimate kinase [Heliobacteriaceae bacterium]